MPLLVVFGGLSMIEKGHYLTCYCSERFSEALVDC